MMNDHDDGATTTTTTTQAKIPIVVVESHAHVLEHIHTVLRRRRQRHQQHQRRRRQEKRKKTAAEACDDNCSNNSYCSCSWSMLHVDSHPDLACPSSKNIPAMACYRPNDEYYCRVTSPCDNNYSNDNNTRKQTDEEEEGKEEQEEEEEEEDNNGNAAAAPGKNLYELLDSTATGMAEWILPLVVAGDLNCVEWIRPSCCCRYESINNGESNNNDNYDYQNITTFPLGQHNYHVGVHRITPQIVPLSSGSSSSTKEGGEAEIHSFMDLLPPPSPSYESQQQQQQQQHHIIKVDWGCPYYCDGDDECENNGETANTEYAPLEELCLVKPLHLIVRDSNDSILKQQTTTAEAEEEEATSVLCADDDNSQHQQFWMLDICLDYFLCENPFLKDLVDVDQNFTYALWEVVRQSDFYYYCSQDNATTTSTTSTSTTTHSRESLRCFRSEIAQLLQKLVTTTTITTTHNNSSKNKSRNSNALCSTIKSMSSCYYTSSNDDKGMKLLRSLIESFESYRKRLLEQQQDANSSTKTTSNVSSCYTTTVKLQRLVDDAIQSLPYLMLPHDRHCYDQKEDPTATAKTPTTSSTTTAETIIRERMNGIRNLLVSRRASRSGSDNIPFMITIARSTREGFTPSIWVEHIQKELLEMLHEVYCCGSGDSTKLKYYSQQHKLVIPSSDCSASPAVAVEEEEEEEASIKNNAEEEKQRHRQFPPESGCRLQVVFDYGQWEGSVIERRM